MKTRNPDISAKAVMKADALLQDKEKSFQEDGLRIKTNKTVINKRAFENDPGQSATASPGMSVINYIQNVGEGVTSK